MYYHYTDIHGLNGILNNRVLWLTDSRFLNDETEGLEIFDYIKEALKKRHRSESDIKFTIDMFIRLSRNVTSYTTSFSHESDLLSQWRGYCPNDGGYCLGFKDLNMESLDVFGSNGSLKQWLRAPDQCYYFEDEKAKIADHIVEFLLKWIKNDDAFDHINLKIKFLNEFHNMNLLFKNVHFHEEREFRVIAQVHEPTSPFFRSKSNLLVPYLSLKFKPNILSEIVIGPCKNKDLAHLSLKEFLNTLGQEFEHVEVKYSSIPYRNF